MQLAIKMYNATCHIISSISLKYIKTGLDQHTDNSYGSGECKKILQGNRKLKAGVGNVEETSKGQLDFESIKILLWPFGGSIAPNE